MKFRNFTSKIAVIAIGVLSFLLVTSCEKEHYVQSLEIFNSTDSNFVVYVYPNSTYKTSEGYFNPYIDDPIPAGGLNSNIEVDTMSSSNSLVFTYDLESTPTELLTMVFDSIRIDFPGSSSTICIVFKPESASNYKENIFDPAINWELRSVEYPAACDMHCPNDYYFESRYVYYVQDSLINMQSI